MADIVTTDDLEVVVRLRSERAATVRVIAASLGADAGFSIDEIDDFRLALSEVFSVLLDAVPESKARIAFGVTASQVSATISKVGSDTTIELDELATTILKSVVDEFVVDGNSVRLVKQATETAASVD